MTAPHAAGPDAVIQEFGTDEKSGLSSAAVENAREKHGWNELATAAQKPAWRKLLDQFSDLVVQILLIAAIISGSMGEVTDTVAILAIVILNALLGFFQEERAEKALAALQSMAAPTARVVRDGRLASVPGRDLVPGDIVEIEAGDSVPADLRLLHTASLRIQEASLTGESEPVEKDASGVFSEDTAVADRQNMAYMSTVTAAGQGRGVVIATGMQTEIGHIANLLQSYEREQTPLQKHLARIGRILAYCCLGLVVVIFALSLWRGQPLLEALLSSVSLAVAGVPEGLPAVVTTALALGLQRMVKRKALIRKLPSVETLGCVSVICSDKTGTLTRNEMTVREVSAGGEHFRVTGSGYAPEGEFRQGEEFSGAINVQDQPDLQTVLRISAYCSRAQIQQDEQGGWKVLGDPTEGALIVLAAKGGISTQHQKPEVLQELPFDSERKAMSVLLRNGSGQSIQYTKGAPESLLLKCVSELRDAKVVELTEQRRREIAETGAQMASRALRVLALAYRETDGSQQIEEERLTLAGLVGMIDPPRDEARDAVKKCHQAGIRPIMITGDHPATAAAIARELGIASASARVVTGQDVQQMSDDDLAGQVATISVYARVAPEHKLRVVRAWKSQGNVVAMTGDGVNDAPAVKAADIGVAMGIAGTDVTREASSMVLMDDNFATIINAVEEGRSIYDNIQKFLLYLLSCNAGELMLMLFASLLGWPLPLLPVHLLWINLVTDGLPALALAMEPPERGIMNRKPRPADESILNWNLGAWCLFQGLLLAVVGLIAFGLYWGGKPEELNRARTVAFCVVVLDQLLRSFSARSRVWTLWQLNPLTNPYLFVAVTASALLQVGIVLIPAVGSVFHVTPNVVSEWWVILLLAVTPVTVIEFTKLVSQLVWPVAGSETEQP